MKAVQAGSSLPQPKRPVRGTGPIGIFPLRAGDAGDAVADVQERLIRLGHLAGDCGNGEFGPTTETALRTFQECRGLHVHGFCDSQTWDALVEAGLRLGDRLLYRGGPMLRGDDVAELQRRLSALGFDPGRIDGIFDDQTSAALADFQRNAGLSVDGLCGPVTLRALEQLAVRRGGEDLVSPLRERLSLVGGGPSLTGRRIAVGEGGGFQLGVSALSRRLVACGALPLPLHHPDPSRRAAAANGSGADCYIGLDLLPGGARCTTAYYHGFSYESGAGRKLAELVQEQLPPRLGLADGGVRGMALSILRETKMPAVVVELGGPDLVVRQVAALAAGLEAALRTWLSSAATAD